MARPSGETQRSFAAPRREDNVFSETGTDSSVRGATLCVSGLTSENTQSPRLIPRLRKLEIYCRVVEIVVPASTDISRALRPPKRTRRSTSAAFVPAGGSLGVFPTRTAPPASSGGSLCSSLNSRSCGYGKDRDLAGSAVAELVVCLVDSGAWPNEWLESCGICLYFLVGSRNEWGLCVAAVCA